MPYVSHVRKAIHDRTYREKHKERIKAYLKKWNAEHPDYYDNMYKNDPKRYLRNLVHNIWKRKEFTHNLTANDLYALWDLQGGLCAITGLRMTTRRKKEFFDTNASMDRIDNNQGYVVGNVRLVCYRINNMRGKLSDQEFRSWCYVVANGPEFEDSPDNYS